MSEPLWFGFNSLPPKDTPVRTLNRLFKMPCQFHLLTQNTHIHTHTPTYLDEGNTKDIPHKTRLDLRPILSPKIETFWTQIRAFQQYNTGMDLSHIGGCSVICPGNVIVTSNSNQNGTGTGIALCTQLTAKLLRLVVFQFHLHQVTVSLIHNRVLPVEQTWKR